MQYTLRDQRAVGGDLSGIAGATFLPVNSLKQRLNDLLRPDVDFSPDALMTLAARAGLDVRIEVRRAA